MVGYISEFVYIGGTSTEFIELAIPAGTDVSGYTVVIYNNSGTVAHTYSLGSLVGTTAGNDVYVIDQGTAGFSDLLGSQAIALVDDAGDVDQFVSYGGGTVTAIEGPADGLTSDNVGNVGFGSSLETNDGGATYFTQTSPNSGTIPCYAPGTLIETPDGPRSVETLRVGDLVETLDNGPQTVRWTRMAVHPLESVDRDNKPVLVKAGALGPNLPDADLLISPQHRILVGGRGHMADVFPSECLAPAKSLMNLRGIRHMAGKSEIIWIHFACDRHEIVRANGCWSESLLLAPMAQQRLTSRDRKAIAAALPPSADPEYLNGPPARPCLSVGEVRRLIGNITMEDSSFR